jgi:serine protease Do
MSDMFQNSYVLLLNSDAFREKTRSANDFSSRDEQLVIGKPLKPVKTLTDAADASVMVKTKDGHGSGFAISNDGCILTNYHVVSGEVTSDANEIWIAQQGGGKLKAKLVRYNAYRDIALLKVDSTFAKAFVLDNVSQHKAFQEIYTIGVPKYAELEKSYQKGVISNDRSAFGIDVIQVSMAINSGNSGGPLFDAAGKLHCVIVSKLIDFSTEGVGFTEPSHKIAESLI